MAKNFFRQQANQIKAEAAMDAQVQQNLSPVMQSLVKAKPPSEDAPAPTQFLQNLEDQTQRPKTVKHTGASVAPTVREIELPGAPSHMVLDNALALPNPFESPKFQAAIQKDVEAASHAQAVPAPVIHNTYASQLPAPSFQKLELTPELKAFLLWFKDRADVNKIVDPTREHATFGSSSGMRDLQCQASIPLTYIIRRDKGIHDRTQAATEGTLAHEVAEEFGQAILDGKPYPYGKYAVKPYTPEMIIHAQGYAEYLERVLAPYRHLPLTYFFEQRICVDAPRDSWGTLDFGFIARDGLVLFGGTVDYKYGVGVEVDTEYMIEGQVLKNLQLALYALGLVGMSIRQHGDDVICLHEVEAHIYQPRIDSVPPPIKFTLPELLEDYLVPYINALDISREFLTQIKAAEQAGATWDQTVVEAYQKVGAWCQFCKAKGLCKAYQGHNKVPNAVELFQKALGAGLVKERKAKGDEPIPKVLYETGVISAEDLSLIALHASKIKSVVDDCVATAIELLQNGEDLPDCALDKTEGRRGWIEDEDLIIGALQEQGIEKPYTEIKKLITLGEAEKQLGPDSLEGLTLKGAGGIKIVHINKVKNPAAVGASAALLFKKLLPTT